MTRLSGRRIAVTGASGFIGGRTVEYLVLGTGAEIRAGVRSFHTLGRLAELPQDRLSFPRLDVLDPDGVRAALDGCDTVVHCAYGSDGDDERRWATTVDGTRTVVRAAEAAGVRRLVHLGTAAVHDSAGREVLDESTPLLDPGDRGYEAAKQAADEVVAASSLDWVILRPTVVYGPWGQDWTATALARVARGVAGLPAGDEGGVCNAVYVDDVVRAILLACERPAAGALVVAADEPVSWGRFYDAFRALLPAPPPPGDEAVEAWEAALYRDRARADIGAAGRALGYVPRFSFDRGMARVAAWAAWRGLVAAPAA
jgi:nucleoside-diphosphate-sugar epimerase